MDWEPQLPPFEGAQLYRLDLGQGSLLAIPAPPNAYPYGPFYSGRLSPDGRWVVFECFVDSNFSSLRQTFLGDVEGGTNYLISSDWQNTNTIGNADSTNALFSPDGRWPFSRATPVISPRII